MEATEATIQHCETRNNTGRAIAGMASSSSSSSSSRFSTLKAFKFPSSKTPPPPPPKEYPPRLNNSSWISLSPNSSLDPPSSPQYMTTPSSAPTSSSPASASASLSPESYSFKKSFIRLAKRSLTPKSPNHDHHLPPKEGDEGISLPWNFKHNLHVDEGYNGLPATWSASLADLGYNEDEIDYIRHRRAPSRSASSHIDQSSPSASSHSGVTKQRSLRRQTSGLSRDSRKPRSAPRKSSDTNASYHQSTSSHSSVDHTEPPLPTSAPALTRNNTKKRSIDESSQRSQGRSRSQPGTSSRNEFADKERPKTPPKHTLRITNGGASPSPPPAYRSPRMEPPGNVGYDDEFPLPLRAAASVSSPGGRQVSGQRSLPGLPPSATTKTTTTTSTSKPLSVGLPRLSLGQDAFSDIWTESIFSSVTGSTTASTSGSDMFSSKWGSDTAESRTTLPSAGSPRPLDSQIKSISSSQKSSPGFSPMSTIPEPSSKPLPAAPTLHMRVDVDDQASTTDLNGISQVLERQDRLMLDTSDDRGRDNRDSNMSSATVTHATIVRGVEIATWARANVVTTSPGKHEEKLASPVLAALSTDTTPRQSGVTGVSVSATGDLGSPVIIARSPSPGSSFNSHSSFAMSSSSSIGSLTRPSSMSSGSRPHTAPVVIGDVDDEQERRPDGSPSTESPHPSSKTHFATEGVQIRESMADLSFVDFDDDSEPEALPPSMAVMPLRTRPSIKVDGLPAIPPEETSGTSTVDHMLSTWTQGLGSISPAQRYRGWLSEVLVPLDGFIDDKTEPRDRYVDLKEIAEGDFGIVYAARVARPLTVSAPGCDEVQDANEFVAIKAVPILPSGSPKLDDLKRELTVMRDVKHPHVLTMDGLYVDLVEDSLWIRMELMERSLADMVTLVEEGVVIPEKVIARFASDIVVALIYLQKMGIAHRDLRSDNLLLNKDGVLKIADFSNAAKVTPESPTCSDIVGVIYWQAPEVRTGSYNPLKADVWSLGATIWEMAQAEPPFTDAQGASDLGDRWPALRQPEIYSRSFHDFLLLCSHPVTSRPDPEALVTTPFIRSASKRAAVVQLLAQCKSIEENSPRRESSDSQGTISQ